jgi:hypothetical protein
VSWLDNDKLAREMFATGHAFELVVAAFFRAHGLTVEVEEQSIRASVTDRENWRGEIDLLVSGVPVEVKSRDVARWFDPLNLCSRRAWETRFGREYGPLTINDNREWRSDERMHTQDPSRLS